jgi:hypothetical protein
MEGIITLPVVKAVQQYFKSSLVDMITEPGPVGILADHPDSLVSEQIYARLELPIEMHKSNGVAIVAHAGCLANPKKDTQQLDDLRASRDEIVRRFPDTDVICLWVPAEEPPIIVD